MKKPKNGAPAKPKGQLPPEHATAAEPLDIREPSDRRRRSSARKKDLEGKKGRG